MAIWPKLCIWRPPTGLSPWLRDSWQARRIGKDMSRDQESVLGLIAQGELAGISAD